MSFKVVSNPEFTHTVPVLVPVDGTHEEQTLKVRFRVVPQDELMRIGTADGTEAYCRAIVVHFGDLVGEDDQPVPSSDAIINRLLRLPYVQIALIRHYTQAMSKARLGN